MHELSPSLAKTTAPRGKREFRLICLVIGLALSPGYVATRTYAQLQPSPMPDPLGSIPARERTLIGHLRSVTVLAFAPDGKTLASGGEDGAIKLWDLAEAQERFVVAGHPEPSEASFGWSRSGITCLAFTPDGKTLASCSEDSTIKLWDTSTGHERITLPPESAASCAVFVPDGQTLVTGGVDGTVRVWDWATGREQFVLTGPSSVGYPGPVPVVSLTSTPDGKTLAAGRLDGSILIWDPATRSQRSLLLSEEDREGTARVEEYYRQRMIFKLIKHQNAVRSLAFTPDGKTLASGAADRYVRLWNVAEARVIRTLEDRGGTTYANARNPTLFMNNGATVISGRGDGFLQVWDAATGRERDARAFGRLINALALSPDGTTLAVAASHRIIKLWDIPSRLVTPDAR